MNCATLLGWTGACLLQTGINNALNINRPKCPNSDLPHKPMRLIGSRRNENIKIVLYLVKQYWQFNFSIKIRTLLNLWIVHPDYLCTLHIILPSVTDRCVIKRWKSPQVELTLSTKLNWSIRLPFANLN